MSKYVHRLIMPAALWANAHGELALGSRKLAWGAVHRHYHDHFCDLAVRRMRYEEEVPSGRQRSALDDWLLMDGPNSADSGSIQQRIASSDLSPGQWLVYLQTGLGEDRSGWTGIVATHEDVFALDEVRLVGPRMPVFSRSSEPRSDTTSSARWSRQVGAIGESISQRVRQSSVMLVGAGRLGGLMAESLVRSGVQKLIVVDPDQIEPHNLDATYGTREEDIGRGKAERLVEHLHPIHSGTHLIALTCKARDRLVFEKAKGVDLMVSCVDNRLARERVASIATRLVKVHLDLGTVVRRPNELAEQSDSAHDTADYDRELGADVRLMLPGCCVKCLGPTLEGAPVARREDLSAPTSLWQAGGRTGSLVSLNAMAAGVAMQTWLDFLAGKIGGSFWHRLRWEQGRGVVSAADRVSSPGNCPICEGM